MSRGKILLIVIPAAMAVGVVIALLFLSSLNSDPVASTPQGSSAAPVSSSGYWTGATAGSTPLVPDSSPIVQSEPEPEAPVSVPEPATTGEAPTNVPTPAGFIEAPTITVEGSTVSITYKTATSSTVNAILTTNGSEISVGTFYDYYNRGADLEGAIEKKANFRADTEGVTETFTLPDTSRSYWLLINTVDNASGQWQSTVTAVPVYTVS